MKTILSALIFIALLASPAFAQSKTKICFQTGTGVNTCQDVTSANPFPVTGGGGGTFNISPSNFLTNAVQSAVSPGAATASNSVLAGCQFVSAGISPTNNQQMAIQCDQYGRVIAIGGTANQIASTPTIQAAAYTINQCIGGFNSVAATSYNGQSAFLTNVRLNSLAGTAYQLMGYVFDSQPTTSVCTDKGTFSLSSADVDKVIGVINATTLAVTGGTVTTPTSATIDFTPPRPFRAGGSNTSGVNTIWYGFAVAAAVTPTSTSDLHLRFGILRD